MIRILDEHTINQIAAGEVIENPASVVKELVDNALDAGASKIVIEATSSGRQLISVRDNGCGMNRDDALLCLERHATSKIRSLDDLWNLTTMGFRGEALSSIAAVSELTLLTAKSDPSDSQNELVAGTRVVASGGKILSCERVMCLPGTTFEIRSLFFNVPARKKFLKSPAKDASDILKVTLQLALGNPHVAFELILNQKRELKLGVQSVQQRLKETLGNEFFSELLPLEYKNEVANLSGYISKASHSRPTRAFQYLFINNRPVSSHVVSFAAKEAYGASLDPARHPAFVLHVAMKPEILDVNVHPQKKEVRFQIDEVVKESVIEAINKTLFTSSPPQKSSFDTSYKASLTQTHFTPYLPLEIRQEVLNVKQEELELPSQFEVLGIFAGYILAFVSWTEAQKKKLPSELLEEGIYLISSREALSRITFDGALSKSSSIQTLLVPVFLELSLQEANCLKEHLASLEKIGLLIREFGSNSFLIEGVPRFLEELDIEETVRALVAKLEDQQIQDIVRALASVARNSKRGFSLTLPLATLIVKKLTECDDPFISPFGARIITIITQAEIEKKFR